MRAGIIQDILLRACADELLQYPPAAFIFRAGVQLPVGKGSGAALPELYVRFRVQRTAVPKALHLFPALRRRLAPLKYDRAQSGLRQHQRGKHTRRSEADHHGPFPALQARDPVTVRLLACDLRVPVLTQNPPLPAAQGHIDGVNPANLRFFPRIQRAAKNPQRCNFRGAYLQRLRRVVQQRMFILLLRQNNLPNPNHSMPLSSPASRPDAQAHCRLYPPQSPSMSKTSPAA